jgi:hypothetical protein
MGKLLAWRGLATVRVLAAGLTLACEDPSVLAWDKIPDQLALADGRHTGSAIVELVTE